MGDERPGPPGQEATHADAQPPTGVLARSAADRIAALTATAVHAPIGMIGLVDGADLYPVGGHGVDVEAVSRIPMTDALTAEVIRTGQPLVFGDVRTDPRVPADAMIRRAPSRAYAAYPVRDAAGTVVGVCVVLDTEPRQWTDAELAAVDQGARVCTLLVAERTARVEVDRQKRFLDAVLDNLHDAVTACDADGAIVFSNSRIRDIRGGADLPAHIDDLAGVIDLRHPDGTPMTPGDRPLRRALTGERITGDEMVIETKDRRRRRYRVDGQPITGPDGERLGAVIALQDVTRRRQSERFRLCELAVVRALGEARTVDQAWPKVLEAIATALGWAHAELWLVDRDADADPDAGDLAARLHPAASWSAPGPARHMAAPAHLRYGDGLAGRAWQAGKPLWLRDISNPQSLIDPATAAASQLHTALAVPVRDGTGIVGVLTVFADVVQDQEEELLVLMSGIGAHIGQFLEHRTVQDLQRQLARSKDEYLALAGHELRTPLTSISAYTGLLREADGPTLAEQGPAIIEVIDRNTAQLRRVIDDLLELSALDTGHAPLHNAPFDFAEVVRDAAAATADAVAGTDLGVCCEVPDSLVVPGDARRLRQVVDNLLGNAVKYSPDGGLITVRLQRTAGAAVLTVSDTGIGVDPAEREKLFGRLYRATQVREKAIPGSGLGLALSRAVAQRHQGSITLESHDGPGTTVRLKLPL
ncbi:sensor histidine kinase [Spirilliplanes yamanashiensis]|uniref:Sensor-like histidine kinase SenX3 n=1 Tax=Spirilliplanes yamanashiensis TaxID=42233 RepID=A0A8J3YBY2_9ACTN|nr:ATP-binding protein [Spirilliplanes yamanashiensis]MDP9818815.1 PAS domain S-box-containing protein [Spirilliplanes yamanashiensis]GIJ05269.1 hypothetical protein Sya03_46210 [Spirilliplanes yamanashiensis]